MQTPEVLVPKSHLGGMAHSNSISFQLATYCQNYRDWKIPYKYEEVGQVFIFTLSCTLLGTFHAQRLCKWNVLYIDVPLGESLHPWEERRTQFVTLLTHPRYIAAIRVSQLPWEGREKLFVTFPTCPSDVPGTETHLIEPHNRCSIKSVPGRILARGRWDQMQKC